jgi:hypothetical protein
MQRSRAELAERILGDLQLGALQAGYRASLAFGQAVSGLTGRFYFYSEPYEFAGTHSERVALSTEAEALNGIHNIAKRKSELAVDGIFPEIVCSSDSGYDYLALFIAFDEKGQCVLNGTN